jgi:hypothetical protein
METEPRAYYVNGRRKSRRGIYTTTKYVYTFIREVTYFS